MSFIQIYLVALAIILAMMFVLWIVSIRLKNVSIVDIFWGFGFVLASCIYFCLSDGLEVRKIVMLILVSIWGLRLSFYLTWRNIGKGEDPRYQKFRKDYGEQRYWWFSFFQVFLLQGILMWLVSAPLLGAQFYKAGGSLNTLDYIGIIVWLTGFVFEAGGDFQLARFKNNTANKGKVLDRGFWHYTRHPNYFGDSAIWCGYALICAAAGSYIPVLGSALMIALIVKVSGVSLLEKSLKETKPQYREYMENTSAFIPWFPKK